MGPVVGWATRLRARRRLIGLSGSVAIVTSMVLPWATLTSCQCEGDATTAYLNVFRSFRAYEAFIGPRPVEPVPIALTIFATITALVATWLSLRPDPSITAARLTTRSRR